MWNCQPEFGNLPFADLCFRLPCSNCQCGICPQMTIRITYKHFASSWGSCDWKVPLQVQADGPCGSAISYMHQWPGDKPHAKWGVGGGGTVINHYSDNFLSGLFNNHTKQETVINHYSDRLSEWPFLTITQNAQQTNIKHSKLFPQLYWGHSVEARSWTFTLSCQVNNNRDCATSTGHMLKPDPQPSSSSTLSCQDNRDWATSTRHSVEGRSWTFNSHARTPTGTVPLLQATDNSQPIPLWSHCPTLGDARQHAEKRSGRQTFLLGDWPGQRLAISEARLLLSFSLLRGWKRHG